MLSYRVRVPDSYLEEIVGLLQHLRELLVSNILVATAPSLYGGGEKGVTEPKGCGGEAGGGGGIEAGVVAVVVAGTVQGQLVVVQSLFAEDEREELVVGDVLVNGGHDVTRLLENCLIRPVRVDGVQFISNAVVFSEEKSVDKRQNCLFTGPKMDIVILTIDNMDNCK
jgi:hypothetical protein